jgi:hypothetical protein
MENRHSQIPLLVLGNPAAPLSGFPFLPLGADFPADLDLFYLVLPSGDDDGLKDVLARLESKDIPPDQVLVAQAEGMRSRQGLSAFVGFLEILPEDSAEDLRDRALARIETQKHRKLSREIESARALGFPSDLTAEEWRLRLETAHLTHGFCSSLDVSPSEHTRCLRIALRERSELPSPWPADAHRSQILVACARLALRHARTPAPFREELRRLSSALPFRARTDLRNVAERCLESLWKGLEHAA